jgi:hypothetical protein
MRHRHDVLVVLLVAAALAAGCEQAPPSGNVVAAPAPPHVSPAMELKQEGDALMGRADYRGAVEKYREAVALDPDDMTIRFALGTARTFLAQRSEAIEDFRVVVQRADATTVEHREAKRWLTARGVASDPGVREEKSGAAVKAGAAPAAPERIVGGRLVGRMEWPGADPKKRSVRGEMTIQGAEASNEHVKRSRPINLGGRFHFYDIPPGQYRLLVRMYSTPADLTLWEQKVMVDDGRPTDLLLTPETARVPPDKFPPPPIT